MKILVALCLVSVVAGCAQMIPARAVEVEPGKYRLEASGNMFASLDSLKEKIDKKAVKLCGEGKFKYLSDTDVSNEHSPAYVNGVDVGGSYTVVTRTVKCL